MAAPFAALEARVAAAAVRHVANATATVGASEFGVVFDAAYTAVVDGMVASAGPQALCLAADTAGLVHGSAIAIGAVGYTVAEIQPDGVGMVLLQLRKA
jgi:hypothetical protein